jgi:hypothetical protein
VTLASKKRRAKFFALVKRLNELGLLLPAPGDLDADDAAGLAEAQMVIAEMNKTRAEMDRVLDQENATRKAS